MEYNHSEVIDIIRSLTDKDPNEILKKWNINKSNTLLPNPDYYKSFVYTLPLIIDGDEVAHITLVGLSPNHNFENLMHKYFGHEDYDRSLFTYSNDTYMTCFLTIYKEFKIPEYVKGFSLGRYKSYDSKGLEFNFKICHGYPKEGKDQYLDRLHKEDAYGFDNGVNIKIDVENGWSLGERINQNIEMRIRDRKINEILL